MNTCSIEGCTAKHHAQGLCSKHYQRLCRLGSLDLKSRSRRLANILNGMKSRCTNPNATHYRSYGGRGISVCDEWRQDGLEAFRTWAYANGYEDQPADTPRGDRLSIDRVDNDGNYEPSNCRWIPMRQNTSTQPHRTPDEWVHRMKIELQQGDSQQVVAARWGVSQQTVGQAAKRHV